MTMVDLHEQELNWYNAERCQDEEEAWQRDGWVQDQNGWWHVAPIGQGTRPIWWAEPPPLQRCVLDACAVV